MRRVGLGAQPIFAVAAGPDSATADEMDDLDRVAGAHPSSRVLRAGDDLPIDLHRDRAAAEAQVLDQRAHREALGDVALGAVDGHDHGPFIPC